jgi:site-specific recombinase XerD
MLNQFLSDGLRGKSARTIKTYGYAIQQFEKWLDESGTNLREYTRSNVLQYIDFLSAKKRSAATINKMWNAIKAFSKWANKRETIDGIEVVKVAYKVPKAMDEIDLNKLISDIDRTGNKRDYAILMTFLTTGIRVSEMVALNRTDFDVSDGKGSIVVRTMKTKSSKGNKEFIPLNAKRAIEMYLEERTDSDPALFLSNRQERISIRSVQNMLEKNGYNAHQIRHSFLTGLFNASSTGERSH